MSLTLYYKKEHVPSNVKVIMDNDFYFQENTIDLLDKNVDSLLVATDKAKYYNKDMCTDRFGANIYWSSLSTGGKAILNVFYNPRVCFWLGECGANATATVLSLVKDGIIVDNNYCVLGKEYLNNIDVIADGVHYTSATDFAAAGGIQEYGIYEEEGEFY